MGFQRIRYYGFLANPYREQKLAHCRELLRGIAIGRRPSSSPLRFSCLAPARDFRLGLR
jgi:hypothetical protein